MVGLKLIGTLRVNGDDGRGHVIYAYGESVRRADGGHVNAGPYLVTRDGREVAPVRDGVYRVYGTGLTLRG